MAEGPSFCRKLRDATKEIHDTSDKLVNLKLGVSLSDEKVWANGLLIFGKIFFHLEKCLEQYPSLSEFDIPGLRRTQAFEQDLDHFFGPSWRGKPDPDPVQKYLEHLQKVAEEDEPLLLVAYIYHLYMGLLSGGQILSKKRQVFGSSEADAGPGNAVTSFANETPSGLKKKLRAVTNSLSEDLSQELQDRIAQEGVNVFKLNNSIIHTVEGVNEIFYKKLFKFLAIVLLIVTLFLSYLWNK